MIYRPKHSARKAAIVRYSKIGRKSSETLKKKSSVVRLGGDRAKRGTGRRLRNAARRRVR